MQFCPISQRAIDIKRYTKISRIKKGGFGMVYCVLDNETSIQYAAKVIDCDNNEEQCKKLIDREIVIMSYVNHPTIIKFIGYTLQDFQGENNATIIMEYAPNGSLSEVLKKIQFCDGPKEYCNTTRQIILAGISRGMKYLHDRNIIHRDLKSGNILLNKDFHPLITDFGLSKFFEYDHSKSQSQMMGTLAYMAPEVIKDTSYNRKADVYSFGILMFEVVTDQPPYPELNNGKLTDYYFRKKVVDENYRPTIPESVSSPIRSLIEQCWDSDPEKRPTFSELFKKLSAVDGGYILEDVDIDEFNLYLDDISVITDPIDKLNDQIEKLEKQNEKLLENSQKMTDKNQELMIENEYLKTKMEKMGISLNSKMFIKENEFKILNVLGSGKSYHMLLIEESNTNERFAAKVFCEKINIDDKQVEIETIRRIEHPSILKIVSFKEETIFNENHLTIVSKYMLNGSLNDFSNLDSHKIFINLLGIALGMQHLHSLNIIHGNLKPSNILIDEYEFPKISDFYLFLLRKKIDFSLDTSLFYSAPEILDGKEFDSKADVYSYSMIAYKLITGKSPFDCVPNFNFIASITKGKRPDLTIIENKRIRNFFQSCWSKNPNSRPTFTQIIEFLCNLDSLSMFHINQYSLLNYIFNFPKEQNRFLMNLFVINKFKLSDNFVLMRSYKVVFLGNTFIGKTAIFEALKNNSIPERTNVIIGAQYAIIPIETEKGNVNLEIWDTSGHRNFLNLLPLYLMNAQAVIFFTNVNCYQEYNNLRESLDIVTKRKRDYLRYLITTKEQLGWENTVEEIQSFAEQNQLTLCRLPLFDLDSIRSIFIKVANDLVKKYPLGVENYHYDDQINEDDGQKQKINECLIS